MAFFKRVLDHLLNQVLVETLANSKTFQRFAVWSHSSFKELSSKGKDAGPILDQQFAKFTEVAKNTTSKLRQDFEQELKKVNQQMQQQQQQPPKK